MKPESKPIQGEMVAITGSPASMKKSELKQLITSTGRMYSASLKPECSTLIVAEAPDSSVIAQALSMSITVITERQFLENAFAKDVIDALRERCCDPDTPMKELCKLAAVAPEAVAQNPIWSILYLENPHFLDAIPGLLRLRLLRLLSSKEVEELAGLLLDQDLSDNIFKAHGVLYPPLSESDLSHVISLGEFQVKFVCDDIDTDMKDCEGCEEFLSLGAALQACLCQPYSTPQEIATQQGIDYQPNMSPSGGGPMRLRCLRIESKYDCFEYEYGYEDEDVELPDDSDIIDKLNSRKRPSPKADAALFEEDPRPLFSDWPVVDEYRAAEGIIEVSWKCECYVPTFASPKAAPVYRQETIDTEFTVYGNGLDDYTEVDYEYKLSMDLETVVAKHLKRDVSRLIEPYMLRLLFLQETA